MEIKESPLMPIRVEKNYLKLHECKNSNTTSEKVWLHRAIILARSLISYDN